MTHSYIGDLLFCSVESEEIMGEDDNGCPEKEDKEALIGMQYFNGKDKKVKSAYIRYRENKVIECEREEPVLQISTNPIDSISEFNNFRCENINYKITLGEVCKFKNHEEDSIIFHNNSHFKTQNQNNEMPKPNDILSKEMRNINYFERKRINLYKTEMCRSYEEEGFCKYGDRCQFAHTSTELRSIKRHPSYKTETCRTFWEEGNCPYGKRCCFIHMENKNLLKNETSQPEIDDSLFLTEIYTSTIHEEDKNYSSFEKNEDISEGINDLEKNFSSEEESNDISDITFPDCIQITPNTFKKDASQEILTFESNSNIISDLKSIKSSEKDNENSSQDLKNMKPFWYTNEANIWVSKKLLFCYVKKRNDKYYRTSIQPNAVGEPVIPKGEEYVERFVLGRLGL